MIRVVRVSRISRIKRVGRVGRVDRLSYPSQATVLVLQLLFQGSRLLVFAVRSLVFRVRIIKACIARVASMLLTPPARFLEISGLLAS
jgi:hypothetical protein